MYSRTRNKLISRQIQPAGDQWPVFLYMNYIYNTEDLWNRLLQSGLLVLVCAQAAAALWELYKLTLFQAYKHIFTLPSSVDQAPKATRSGNAQIHGMQSITKPSIAYISIQVMPNKSLIYSCINCCTQACFALTSTQRFSCTDQVTNSEHFYNSVLKLFDNPEEKEEVHQLIMCWNRLVSWVHLLQLLTPSHR